jgi:hypothetical protein
MDNQIMQTVTIHDRKTGEFEFSIDFQNTPGKYRSYRIGRLEKKYPLKDFTWEVK